MVLFLCFVFSTTNSLAADEAILWLVYASIILAYIFINFIVLEFVIINFFALICIFRSLNAQEFTFIAFLFQDFIFLVLLIFLIILCFLSSNIVGPIKKLVCIVLLFVGFSRIFMSLLQSVEVWYPFNEDCNGHE